MDLMLSSNVNKTSTSLDKIHKVDFLEMILYHDVRIVGGTVHVAAVCSLTIRCRRKLHIVSLNVGLAFTSAYQR